METTWVPISQWMDKEDMVYKCAYVHTHSVEYYSAVRKMKSLFVTIWMSLEGIM